MSEVAFQHRDLAKDMNVVYGFYFIDIYEIERGIV